jgi:hypothetical protein
VVLHRAARVGTGVLIHASIALHSRGTRWMLVDVADDTSMTLVDARACAMVCDAKSQSEQRGRSRRSDSTTIEVLSSHDKLAVIFNCFELKKILINLINDLLIKRLYYCLLTWVK